ncbi:hypothetical protein [Rickettsiella endosymbiont of Litargus connexus]|uniref:hypothetical protein n=1 Tax=Rickettsiella endosymbiont of Litargus connexus TaxID=3066237 RepID=UPI00376EAD4A
MEIYNQINQRLSEPCWIRFKKEQLPQERLLDVALEALAEVNEVRVIQQKRNLDYGEEGHKSRFNTCFEFLLSSQRELALLNCEKEMWLEEIYVFPKVYGDYSAYVKEYSALFQLHLDTFISTQGKTVGYLLLEKALETKNAKAIEALLKANVNLFEIPPNKEPFLKRALQGRRRCAIKKLLLGHIRKNSSLMELVVGHFSEHLQ